jgi:hypothetical protein
MSSHGRRRQGQEPVGPAQIGPAQIGPAQIGPAQIGPAQIGWALLVIVAALIGGLAAATLVHTSLIITVIVSLVAGGIAVLAVFRSPARPPQPMAGEREEDDFGRYPAPRHRQASQAVPPAPFASAAPDPTAPAAQVPAAPVPAAQVPAASDRRARGGPPANEAVVQLLPLPPQPGNAEPADAPWWDSAQGGPPSPSPGAKRAPAPDLSTYLASTFIAQCPRCGAFRFDIRRARSGWDFRCESCEHTWTWQPGTPWPPVRVMPRGRKE